MDQVDCACCKQDLTKETIWCKGCRAYVCDGCDCLEDELCWNCLEEYPVGQGEEGGDPYFNYDGEKW